MKRFASLIVILLKVLLNNRNEVMKKILTILILSVIVSGAAFSGEYYYEKLSYGDFVEWMKSVEIPDYELKQYEQEGSVETYNVEYSAMFVKDNYDALNVRIGHPNVFYQYEDLGGTFVIDGPFDFIGFPTVYIYSEKDTKPQNMTYFLVRLPDLNATFSITAMTREKATKEQFIDYAKIFKLESIGKQGKVSWLKEIPIPMRLPGELLKIEKKKSEEPGVKFEYLASIEKNGALTDKLKSFFDKRKGWLDLTTHKNFTLICKTTTDMDELKELPDGEPIEFIYYEKK